MSEDDNTSRAFVLGLDGIPWSLLERWADEGHLPNVAATMAEGAAGPLESTVPPTTALAWPAIATGVGAHKHGIYGFQRLTPEYSHRMNTSADRRQPALWNLLSPAVVGNVPMTYPPEDVDGKLVSGMMTPSLDGFTHPPSLADEVDERVDDYRVGLDWQEYGDRPAAFREEMADLVAARTELLELLMETDDWRLFFFVYTAPDRLQHLLWAEDALLEHYQQLDAILGDVREYVAERGATLYVVSDHGFGPIDRYVYVNRVLEEEGYLTRRSAGGTRGALADLGVTKDAVLGALDRVGVDAEALVHRLPRSLTDAVASQVPGDHVLYDVAFAETRAFLHGPGNLYVNDAERFADGPVAPSAVPRVKRSVASLLRDLTDPDTGEPVLQVWDGDEVFPADDRSPDLVVRGRPGYETEVSLTDHRFAPTGSKAAGHRSEGVFLAWGPDVEPGATPEDASVVDVAPTLLHGVGEPVPAAADGRVLSEVFTPGSRPASREVRRRAYGDREEGDVEADFGDVEERLKGLGYME